MGTARHIAVAARASATRAAAAGSRSSPAGSVRGGASRCGCCCQKRRAVASFRKCLCKPIGARHGAASPRAAAQCPAPETRAPRGRRRAEVALALEQPQQQTPPRPPRKVPVRCCAPRELSRRGHGIAQAVSFVPQAGHHTCSAGVGGAQLAEVGHVRGFVYLERAEGASPRAPPVRTPTAGRSETARAKSRLVRC